MRRERNAGGDGAGEGEVRKDDARIEREVRTRLAEVMSSAGIPSSQIAASVLYLLPSEFTNAYAALYHRALRVAGDQGVGDKDAGRVDKDGRSLVNDRVSSSRNAGARMVEGKTLGGMGTAKATGKRHRRSWIIADELAFSRKGRIDKTLRKLGRDMVKGMGEDLNVGKGDGEEKGERGGGRCSGRSCKKFVDPAWRFCPSCGTRQRGSDEKEGKES